MNSQINRPRLYIIAEEHPWYDLFNEKIPVAKQRAQKILEKERGLVAEVKPQVVFLEYPENWGLEEELTYRTTVLMNSYRSCGSEISTNEAKDIIRKGFEQRINFYSELADTSRLVFLEDYDLYKESGILLATIWRRMSYLEERGKFQENIRKREETYSTKIQEEIVKKLQKGLAILGNSHVSRKNTEEEWLTELGKLADITIVSLGTKDVLQ